ncbi:MAG TPA: dephospho-CoA kinase [Treponemataceae bacterium]|nr:dephospho-CoA kinase [Treponemataceae bacterium]
MNKSQLILGLTGPMAAGKNAAANILTTKGFLCIDADMFVHKAIEIAKPQIIDAFEKQATLQSIALHNTDKSINRKALALLVFKNKKNLAIQESIVHPIVERMISEYIQKNKNKNIVLNATVLYKVPSINRCQAIIFVTAPFFTRLKRAKKRDNLSILHIFKRFWQQKGLFSKYFLINPDTYRVKNCGSLNDLEKNIEKVLSLL